MLLMLGGAVLAETFPQAPPLPQQDNTHHVGATTCAGSSCHGISQSWQRLRGSSVAQNEYSIWKYKDRHARAYETLRSPASARIAENLGLQSAHTASVCLDCHADNVPARLRERTFQISQGVGCEACHGGAREWISSHAVNQGNHQENLQAGMFPTEDPLARAALCLSCHLGNEEKFVTHRMMGAGHPRLSFELDTFTSIQPAHHIIDADYLRRKGKTGAVETWMVGQVVATEHTFAALADPAFGRDGLFPELVFYDCQACHHHQDNLRWQPRPSVPNGPGQPRLNDAHLLMLRVIAQALAPELSEPLLQAQLSLHTASIADWSALEAAAQTNQTLARKLAARIQGHTPTTAELWSMVDGLVALGMSGELFDYAAAEQATMALSALLIELIEQEAPDTEGAESMKSALEECYSATEDENAWSPVAFQEALTTFQTAAVRAR